MVGSGVIKLEPYFSIGSCREELAPYYLRHLITETRVTTRVTSTST